MKKYLLFSGIFAAIFLISTFSCQKNIETAIVTKAPDSAVFKKIIAYLNARRELTGDEGKLKIDAIKTNLLFDELRLEKFNANENLIIIPLKENFKTRNNIQGKSYKNLVVIEDSKGNYRKGDIVEFIPKNNNLMVIPKDYFADVYNNKKGLTADGVISILTLSDRNIIDLTYNNGTLEKYRYTSPMIDGKLLYKNNIQQVVNQCINWYWQYYVNGLLVYEEYAFTTCSGDCQETFGKWNGVNGGDGVFIISCGGGAGGSSSGYQTVVTVDSVTSYLTQPCLIDALNAISDTTLKNQLTKLYQQTFVGIGKTHSLLISQVASTYNQFPGQSHPYPGSTSTWEIQLNSGYNHLFTKELWGSIILHEMVHGFIQKNDLDFSPTSQFSNSHEIMLQKWITQLQSALVESFNISENDAFALSIAGFDDILDETSPTFKNALRNWVDQNFPINYDQAVTITDKYLNQTSGTICP